MKSLNRQQALEMISAVVDGEVPAENHRRFFEYLRHDDEMRREFESHLRIKLMICCHYRRMRAPEELRTKVAELIRHEVDRAGEN